jgi:hypothetical protein
MALELPVTRYDAVIGQDTCEGTIFAFPVQADDIAHVGPITVPASQWRLRVHPRDGLPAAKLAILLFLAKHDPSVLRGPGIARARERARG